MRGFFAAALVIGRANIFLAYIAVQWWVAGFEGPGAMPSVPSMLAQIRKSSRREGPEQSVAANARDLQYLQTEPRSAI